MAKEKWFYHGRKVYSEWITTDRYNKLKPITQVYGICFTKDEKILIVREQRKHNWTLPGGTPEGKETPEQTLIREVNEEASIELSRYKMVGCFEVHFPNNPNKNIGDKFYQLRYIALIKKIKKQTIDPATNKLFDRKLISPKDFNKYIKWGLHGKKMFKHSYEIFKILKLFR